MIIGVVLFSGGIINVFSSLLLFVGGYVAIKNTFDYRIVKKNIKKVNISNEIVKKNDVDKDISLVTSRKARKRNTRVRKRVK